MPLSHSAYAATESAGVRCGSQPSARSALMSEKMWRVSPKRYSPVTTAGHVRTVLALTTSANSLVVTARPPPTLKTRPDRAVVVEHQHVGVHHVVDVDVVADRAAVLVQGRRLAEQVAEAEDAARARVGVVHRLPRALHDAVAQRDGRDAVPAAEVDGDHLLAELRHAVRVLRVRDPLRRGAASRAGRRKPGTGCPIGPRRGPSPGACPGAARRRPGSGTAPRPSPTATTPPPPGPGRGARPR